MEHLTIMAIRHTIIHAMDEPGPGGACHEYVISRSASDVGLCDGGVGEFGLIRFQNGPVKEAGVNGCHQEDLIAIVIHRLRGFQSGEFACRENAIALTKLEESLHWLNHRTTDRRGRGVEGTNVK